MSAGIYSELLNNLLRSECKTAKSHHRYAMSKSERPNRTAEGISQAHVDAGLELFRRKMIGNWQHPPLLRC
jgi:hypothetical protein